MISVRSAAVVESAVTVAVSDFYGSRPAYGRILPTHIRRPDDIAEYASNHAHHGACGVHAVPCLIDPRKTGHLKGHHHVCPVLKTHKRPTCECQMPKTTKTKFTPRLKRDVWL